MRDRFRVDAVALVDAVGHVSAHVGVGRGGLERVIEDARGGDAVDVVVAVDHDALPVAHGLHDALGGAGDAGQARRVVQIAQRRIEESAHLIGAVQSALQQHLTQQRRQPRRLGHRSGLRVGLGDAPAFEMTFEHPAHPRRVAYRAAFRVGESTKALFRGRSFFIISRITTVA